MKKYIVTGSFQYEVEAENVEAAEIAAADAYMKNPDTDYHVSEIDAEGEVVQSFANGVLEIESDIRNGYKPSK